MDRVRLGRVLGRGARLAARTAYEAVDAATASAPTAQPAAPRQPVSSGDHSPQSKARPQYARALQNTAHAANRIDSSLRQAKQGVLAPVKRASRALTLEISGSFFALFAMSFGLTAWKTRAALHDGQRGHVFALIALSLLFVYFAASSFWKARRISQGR